jgi:hypothetical protein
MVGSGCLQSNLQVVFQPFSEHLESSPHQIQIESYVA